MLGAGEYVVQLPGQSAAGHFGLAVKDYAHSTAPNRRFPDVITQRLVKAALAGSCVSLRKRRTRVARAALHRPGRRGEESRTAGRKIGGGAAAWIKNRRSVRRDRHRRLRQGNLGPHFSSAGGRQARTRFRRPGRRPPAPRAIDQHRRGTRLCRLRENRRWTSAPRPTDQMIDADIDQRAARRFALARRDRAWRCIGLDVAQFACRGYEHWASAARRDPCDRAFGVRRRSADHAAVVLLRALRSARADARAAAWEPNGRCSSFS